jgi:hypothetical protein
LRELLAQMIGMQRSVISIVANALDRLLKAPGLTI